MSASGGADEVYDASPIKRRRATNSEMEQRARFLIDYAAEHGPMSVRGLYYQAVVAEVAGIDKTESGYGKVQRQILDLRDVSYGDIVDATRWMRKPRSYDSVKDAIAETARTYRRNLWLDADYSVTSRYDAPPVITRGFNAERSEREDFIKAFGGSAS